MNPKPTVLVACTRRKLDHPAPAADLYQSTWFRYARRYAEAYADRWYILSAKHGLLRPDQVIEAYDLSLASMSQSERQTWARQVATRLVCEEMIDQGRPVVLLAGKVYRQFLAADLHSFGFAMAAPLASLGIGQQVAWLKGQIENR